MLRATAEGESRPRNLSGKWTVTEGPILESSSFVELTEGVISQVSVQSGACFVLHESNPPDTTTMTLSSDLSAWTAGLEPTSFEQRHQGASSPEQLELLHSMKSDSLDDFSDSIIPAAIRRNDLMALPEALTEHEALKALRSLAEGNRVRRCFYGQGFAPATLAPVILRNVLENPGWYTQYTPYQAEIAQGRLEALFNFQTLIAELTGLPYANASLLDEASACAEALGLAYAHGRQKKRIAVADRDLHPQNLQLLQTRARSLGVELRIQDVFADDLPDNLCAVLVQVPDTRGRLREGLQALARRVHEQGALLCAVVDPLAQCLLAPASQWSADIAVGSTQRLGLPMGYGGPHAGFIAVSDALKRRLPGRIVGLSIDSKGRPAYRLALQTREQHIRRDKATSNICTAQVLPALLSTFTAMLEGPEGLRRNATRVATLRTALAQSLSASGWTLSDFASFDSLEIQVTPSEQQELLAKADSASVLLRAYGDSAILIQLNDTHDEQDIAVLLSIFGIERLSPPSAPALQDIQPWLRVEPFLQQDAFQQYHSEHEMLRLLTRLQGRDLSLTHSMIPLGSCTMKLNAAAEMLPVTWPEFGNIHPAAPEEDVVGYRQLCQNLEDWLSEITELPACSLQPNAGSQGELAGLLAIREYHLSRGDVERNLCFIPASAHGTNPASAVIAGMKVLAVACDDEGNVDKEDLVSKLEAHPGQVAALMITYPSTHGVFEEAVPEICKAVHDAGGMVYMDGANMNAQVGLCSPGRIGADVCHLNLHKTFCIPHGGGGPGMGPICAVEALRPFLPTDPMSDPETPIAISSSAYGSASILVISWMYIRMMGPDGLKRATQLALLNANVVAERLRHSYPVLYSGRNGRVAHECILDLRELTKRAGIVIDDIAKRLMDFGFHAPTMSFPVPGTLMIEPTESESPRELARFCEAMIQIRREIQEIIDGRIDADVSALHHAPHTALDIASDSWDHPYTREEAAYPLQWVRDRKFWPASNRIDNTYGDRNLVCTCEWNPKV